MSDSSRRVFHYTAAERIKLPLGGGRGDHPSLQPVNAQCYIACMVVKALEELLRRAETWPEPAQAELVEIALEIEAGLRGGEYHPTQAELDGIDRGLKALREGRFATEEQVAAVFAKHRRT